MCVPFLMFNVYDRHNWFVAMPLNTFFNSEHLGVQMIENIQDLRLSEDEKIWLKEVYDSFMNDSEVTRRKIKIKLLGKIPFNFNPYKHKFTSIKRRKRNYPCWYSLY